MFIYEQRTGRLRQGDALVCFGYSGYGDGKNDPLAQARIGIGPIPQGAWWIGDAFDSPDHGPHSMHLVPVSGTETYKRSGFLIHGDSASKPGEASHGCIILPRPVRERISNSLDKLLIVLSGNP